MVKHIWFDFSDTIASIDKMKHDAIKYGEFARLKNLEVTSTLKSEYDELFERLGRSNSNIFVTTFDLPANFWPKLIDKHLDIYSLADRNIPAIMKKLSQILPISVFSNIETREVMEMLGIDTRLFTHILSSASLTRPKPHIEGYEKLIELSNIPAEDVLYIGDELKKDVLPAKSVGLKTGYMWGSCVEADYEFANFEDIFSFVSKG